MGTSKDRTAGSGGAWTPLKTATASWVRGVTSNASPSISEDRARRVVSRGVAALGGAGGAAATATAGSRGLQRLGGFLAGVGGPGLAPTLQTLGLGALVGHDRFDVLDELVTLIAGDGDDLDSAAARDAMCDVLDEMFEDADAWDDLADINLTADQVRELLGEFLARFIHNRMPVIAERLARITDPHQAQRANDQMLDVIRASVSVTLRDVDAFAINWAGPAGSDLSNAIMTEAYELLEDIWGEE